MTLITTPRPLLLLALLGSLSTAALAQTDRVDRAQLRARTAAAVVAGRIPRGELSLADLQAAVPTASTLTRAEVRERTRLAIARGDEPAREATASELELIRLAGERARNGLHTVAAR